jgi:hypothetical protein
MTHTKDEALKLARKALEHIRRQLKSWDEGDKAITAIKKSLAAPVQPVAWREALERIADPRNTHFAGDAQVVAREALATPPAAPVQPAASLKEADVLMMAETHGIDPSTNGLYGFYIDCISNQPAAQPAPVPTSWMEMVTVNLLREGVNKHKARELAEHFYGLAPGQPAVPEGWKLVPVEPTGEMLAALAQEWHSSRYEAFRGRYALMLAAAPEKGGAA